MTVDQFTERLAIVRTRFAANLNRKIDGIDQALPKLSGNGDDVLAALAVAHRGVHELCGIGPTVGFAATGQAARSVERMLLQPLRAKRGLTDTEVASLRDGTLRVAHRGFYRITVDLPSRTVIMLRALLTRVIG